jgi:hypothetical protein
MGQLTRGLKDWVQGLVPDRLVVEWRFRKAYGRPLDLARPCTFDEKLAWYKLYYRRAIMTQLADKYAVRQYVIDKGHGRILNDLYGVYDRAEDVPFDALPDAFVLKTTHASGWNIICRDRRALDVGEARARLRRWLARSYYLAGREWSYKNIRPRIVCERYLENEGLGELIDYKWYCYGGRPEVMFVCCGRFKPEGVRYDAFDMDWNQLHTCKGRPAAGLGWPRPPDFEAMREIARDLCQGFPFIRVDLYSVQGRIYFGELTFYPDSGLVPFSPEPFNRFFGDFLQLPERPVIECDAR